MTGQPYNEEYVKYLLQAEKKQPLPGSQGIRPDTQQISFQQQIQDYPLNQFAELSPDILFILDSNLTHIEYINPATSRLLKLEDQPEAGLKAHFLNLIVDEDLIMLRRELQAAANRPEQQQGETEIRIVDGKNKLRYFNLRYALQLSDKRKPLRAWLCQARDITENKAYIKEIQDNKRKLQMALDGSNMGVWSYDPASQLLECDERVCQLFGLRANELSGAVSQVFKHIHPEDRAYAILTAINTLKRQGRFNHEFRVCLPQQPVIRHVAVIGEYITNEQSGTAKITGVCLDISQGKMADNKSKTNEAFLEESQRIAKIGCFDWDLLLDKLTMTSELYRILDIGKKDDISLENFYARIHPEDLKQVKQMLKNTILQGGQFDHEFRMQLSGGQTRILWAQGKATKNSNHYTEHIIGAIQDVTEKKEQEKALHTQNLIIKSILGNLPVIILIVDKHGIVKSLLGSGLERIGMDENQTVGQSIFEQYPAIGKYIRRVLQGETVSFTEEVETEARKLHFLSYYFYDKEKELAIGFSIDITAQKQTEKAFEQVSAKNLELKRMNELMDIFVYAVAHDLKNPINNLDMIATLINESGCQQEQLEYLKALQKSVSRLKQTINGLTEVVEIESSRGLSSRMLHFSDVFQHISEDLLPLLSEKDGRLETNFEQTRICYNEAFMTSILKNLLSNAIKYSSAKRKPHISIRTENAGNYVVLSIQDNGIGIDLHQHRHKLFKPFKRFSRQASGTGVGLHLIKSMVEKNGGRIEVESTSGKGTIFRCYLMPYSN